MLTILVGLGPSFEHKRLRLFCSDLGIGLDRDRKTRQPSPTTIFDAAAARLFASLSAGTTTETGSKDLQTVAGWLGRLLSRSYRLSEFEAEEIAQEVIVKVLEVARSPGDRLEEIRNPGAYLAQLARNKAIDHIRRRARGDVELSDELSEVLPSHDDEIAALLDASANAVLVRAAMRAASEAQDHLTQRVISTWLDIADELGEVPTSRDVAKRAKVSHTSVNQALKRFKGYFPARQGM